MGKTFTGRRSSPEIYNSEEWKIDTRSLVEV